jgi:hypothetical protein
VLGIDPEYRAADRLLKLAREEQRKTEATAEDTPQSPIINASRSVANTSGQGKDAIIPEEIKKWNWGAFLLNGIWGPANGVYIALLSFIPFLISPFLVLLIDPIYLYLYLFIPITLPMSLILGIRGNKWAWQNKRWESVEHFQKTQQEWTQLKIIIPAAAFWLFMFSSPYLL